MLGGASGRTFRLRCRRNTGDGSELDLDPQVHDVVAALGGSVADDGLFRVHMPIDVIKRTRMVEARDAGRSQASLALTPRRARRRRTERVVV